MLEEFKNVGIINEKEQTININNFKNAYSKFYLDIYNLLDLILKNY